MHDRTMVFSLQNEKDDQIKTSMKIVYEALKDNNARNIISKIDRDDLLEALVKSYLNLK